MAIKIVNGIPDGYFLVSVSSDHIIKKDDLIQNYESDWRRPQDSVGQPRTRYKHLYIMPKKIEIKPRFKCDKPYPFGY